MAADIPPAIRAQLDQELTSAIDGLRLKAAEYDGVDTIEANVELMGWLLGNASHVQLAAAAAALALELHRQPGGGS